MDGPAEAVPGKGRRAKTRILGFHSQEIATDPFAAAEPAEPGHVHGWFPAGWIVVVEGPGRGASFTVSTSVSTIGRGEDQAICLDFGDQSISRQHHAAVAYDSEQNKFFIGHGGKSNVVRLNGTPVLATEELSNGDLIRIGKTTLRFIAFCGGDFAWGEPGDEEGMEHGAS
ncbi:FHA domain-containing protein [Rhodobacterales bacterium HKCCE2091]|nr:FHA domain-containing protein [Rhodobacterales bacterium HKCCE2091]